jgi:glycosyltransferase involved in cell wall biosynthesis
MSLRILHVLRPVDSDAGRSIEAVCELSTAQFKFGHAIEIVTLGHTIGKRLERLGIPIYGLQNDQGSYGYNAKFVRWMKEHAGAYDCVIVHGIWDYCALGTWWALRDSTVPYFVFAHGMLDPWFKTYRPIRHLLRWLYWPWGVYPVLRDAHAVFFLCDDERNRARQAFWIYDCHEFVVRSGSSGISQPLVDGASEIFLSAHSELRGKRLFTFFADQDPAKGVRALAGAIGWLSERGIWNSQTMRLVIAGSADQAIRVVVEHSANQCGVGHCVYWTGALTESERWGVLRASEVFLRPSSYEISSNSVADALSAGTPVLVSTGVAIWKDLVNVGAGLADEGTSQGCARLLKKWVGLTHDEQAAMRLRARRCYEDRYTLVGAAHSLTSAIYLLVGVHRDGRRDLKPLKPASELF